MSVSCSSLFREGRADHAALRDGDAREWILSVRTDEIDLVLAGRSGNRLPRTVAEIRFADHRLAVAAHRANIDHAEARRGVIESIVGTTINLHLLIEEDAFSADAQRLAVRLQRQVMRFRSRGNHAV